MRIKTLAMAAVAMAAVGAAYPVQMEIYNATWRPAVEPETRAEIAPYSATEVTIRDADHLQRVLSNLEQLNALSGWPDESCLYIDLPGVTEADLVVAELGKAPAAPEGGDSQPVTDPAPAAADAAPVTEAQPAAADAPAAPAEATATKATGKTGKK